jgi:hypothetical protein
LSRTTGHCFYDVQSSARRSARGAGTIGSDRSSPRHKKELRNTLASARSEANFFRLTGNRVLKTAFVLWDGPIAPSSPIPSEVRPFEPWCHHRGSCICAATCARSASRFVAHRPRPGGFRWVCMYRSASQIGAYRSSCISLSMYSFASLKPRSSLISVRRPDTIPTFLLFSVFAYANGSPV